MRLKKYAKLYHGMDFKSNAPRVFGFSDAWVNATYNDRVTIRGIPLAAYDYVVNGKSAIEWVMERYQVTTHKESGIVTDPNKWLEECGDERYIVDLILKVVTVSMETLKIVEKLPMFGF